MSVSGFKKGSFFYDPLFDFNHDGVEDLNEQYEEFRIREEMMNQQNESEDDSESKDKGSHWR